MIDTQLLTFVGLALIVAITPGADTMLVMRSVLASDRQAGFVTTIGICVGLLVHACLSALGLSLILVSSPRAFEIFKLIGGGYLIFLGLQSIWQAFQKSSSEKDQVQLSTSPSNKSIGQFFLKGFLTNLLNPKVVLFYLAFLPQFIQPTEPLLLKSVKLCSIHLSFTFIWLVIVSALVEQVKKFLTHPQVTRGLLAATGSIFIGLGAWLALERL